MSKAPAVVGKSNESVCPVTQTAVPAVLTRIARPRSSSDPPRYVAQRSVSPARFSLKTNASSSTAVGSAAPGVVGKLEDWEMPTT